MRKRLWSNSLRKEQRCSLSLHTDAKNILYGLALQPLGVEVPRVSPKLKVASARAPLRTNTHSRHRTLHQCTVRLLTPRTTTIRRRGPRCHHHTLGFAPRWPWRWCGDGTRELGLASLGWPPLVPPRVRQHEGRADACGPKSGSELRKMF